MANIFVYYSALNETNIEDELYPKERMDEIKQCRSEKVRLEKYQVWHLLEYAMNDALNLDIDNCKFTKLPIGKWICDKCKFSLTHTNGLVAVAVGDADIGIDAELKRTLHTGIEKKILTARELVKFASLPDTQKNKYLIEKWCAKEAIFKSREQRALMPTLIETELCNTQLYNVEIDGKDYVIAVAADGDTVMRNDIHYANVK